MNKQEFIELYRSKLQTALNGLDNDAEIKQPYIDLVNKELANTDNEVKAFLLKQLIIRHAENDALLELIQDLVLDERD
ncbi:MULTISPECIES: hypothetical protein [Staphylococcus]|uniref:hypothetical protein n=1 Tax=Staphylococcus TaxID=1279 RepID=UPI0005005FB6|nr:MULTISPECIES: hypothetical protein [Staphylococcus]MBX8336710.1 hypothetical protein [Staphylococcus aureus]MCS4973489.1 hypothetical protein [Staphylococcus aureus]MDT3913048.1 hypothetical protein [Staphylococcus aureus]MDT4027805.1 hypothetical protein [Staphylococcus aureus]UVJ16668.1 hypothetical protein NW947_04470 [Staphylococcus aureus]